MKYFSIILTVMVTALMGRATESQTGWFYDQSTQQAFYLFDDITIDGLVVEGDGTGEGDGGCELLGTCDVVGAFRWGVCDDPGYQSGEEQMSDRLLGIDSVDHENYGGREQDSESSAGSKRASSERIRVSIAPHFRQGDLRHGCRGRQR